MRKLQFEFYVDLEEYRVTCWSDGEIISVERLSDTDWTQTTEYPHALEIRLERELLMHERSDEL